ncbi:hypothetical protein U1Q18_002574 [Sarracenia purpurea var. burkii]
MCLSQHASAMCARKWASPLLLSDHVLLLGAIKCYCWLPYGGGYCKVMLRVAAKCYCWLPRGGGHCKVMLWVAAMVAISVGQCEPTDGSMLALLGVCYFPFSHACGLAVARCHGLVATMRPRFGSGLGELIMGCTSTYIIKEVLICFLMLLLDCCPLMLLDALDGA